MTGTPTMRVRQVFDREDADLAVKVVTDREDATLDVGVVSGLSQADVSVIVVTDSEDADEFVLVVEGALFPPSGPSHLLLDGSPGTYASTPDKPTLDLTMKIDFRISVAMDDWSPTDHDKVFINKLDPNFDFGPGYAWQFGAGVLGSGQGGFFDAFRQDTGIYDLRAESDQPFPVTDGAVGNLRFVFDPQGGTDPGSPGDHFPNVSYYTRDDDNVGADDGWALLGLSFNYSNSWEFAPSPLVVTIGQLEVGGYSLYNVGEGPPDEQAENIAGQVYKVILKNESGTIVASPNFTTQPPGTTSFSDAQGNVWTLSGNAAIV